MLKDYFLNIKQELEEQLELIESNYQKGKYRTLKDKEICTLIYNIKKHEIIIALSIIKDNYKKMIEEHKGD